MVSKKKLRMTQNIHMNMVAARRLVMEYGYSNRGSSSSAVSEMTKEAVAAVFVEEK